MADFFYRTEALRVDEIKEYFVETDEDRKILHELKGRNPVLLVGSRGVGKSFLFRVAEAELLEELPEKKVLPVYITFRKSSLIHTDNEQQFHNWMLSRICNEILRILRRTGRLSFIPSSLSVLSGQSGQLSFTEKTKIELISEQFEESWKNPKTHVDTEVIPTVDDLINGIEDICLEIGIKRIVIFIDEAAHIFLPEQQRQFFTLFRDLRSPYLTCHAAIYPGVTVFGETFEPIHDATVIPLYRNIQDENFISNMRDIVVKQTEDSNILKSISRQGENFAILAYASTGNPRHLLKTIAQAPKLNSTSINNVVREYYRTEIWAEHSKLAEKYPGHRALIDWGREFIETEVLPGFKSKNDHSLQLGEKTTSFFWVHRDTPEPAKESLRLLQYSGVVLEHSDGIKVTRSKIGTRFLVNLGCLFAEEAKPAIQSFMIAKSITPRNPTEYGSNHSFYESLLSQVPNFKEANMTDALLKQLDNPISDLDLTSWEISSIESLGLNTIGDILAAPETKLQSAYYVGEKRARRIRNVAIAAVYEYLSG
ncbi:DUF4470 domain-containing protein [Bacillus amyloliquefaciens]|uniref:ORC-CDC6 family AAA ATPase n=1 Tax=Bacillus velezensis TaxID=492670 RepID=UPI001C78379C|nr:DUF4470 domain-containing protein [Bacillus amyloliquefaciens]